MHRCSECNSEYPSAWAAAQCEEECLAEGRNTREYFARKNVHRKD